MTQTMRTHRMCGGVYFAQEDKGKGYFDQED